VRGDGGGGAWACPLRAYLAKFANSTLIILFSKMLKISRIISS
jgi:hypothetical protein